MLEKSVLESVKESKQGYISSIFLRENKNIQHRCILNLKNVNTYVTHRHFKKDIHNKTLSMMSTSYYMSSADLTDAYYSVIMSALDQKYLMFWFE